MKPLAYIGNMLDRRANERGDSAWLEGQRRSPRLRMVHINGDKTIVADGRLVTDVAATGETVFLGIDEAGGPWVARPFGPARGLPGLRKLGPVAPLSAAPICAPCHAP